MAKGIKTRIAVGTVGAILGAGVGGPSAGGEVSQPAQSPEARTELPDLAGPVASSELAPAAPPQPAEAPAPTPDNRLPWQHEADKVGPENATPKIMELVEKAKIWGWQVIGNDESGGEGAFVSITSPKGGTSTPDQLDFNTKVNAMLDEVETLPPSPKTAVPLPPEPPFPPKTPEPLPTLPGESQQPGGNSIPEFNPPGNLEPNNPEPPRAPNQPPGSF